LKILFFKNFIAIIRPPKSSAQKKARKGREQQLAAQRANSFIPRMTSEGGDMEVEGIAAASSGLHIFASHIYLLFISIHMYYLSSILFLY